MGEIKVLRYFSYTLLVFVGLLLALQLAAVFKEVDPQPIRDTVLVFFFPAFIGLLTASALEKLASKVG